MADQQAQPDRELGPVLVVIPTYNERDNIGKIVKRLHTALPTVHALVVDDGSPDGTGQLADEMAAADDRVHVLHRTEKAGLGAAYIAATHKTNARCGLFTHVLYEPDAFLERSDIRGEDILKTIERHVSDPGVWRASRQVCSACP